MASIYDLPPEMLLKIFEHYLETEGYANLIRNIYNVCTSWRDFCKDPSLWVTYNGSLSFEDMMMVCEGGCFKNTLNFTISSCDSVSKDQVSKLFSELKNVNFIDLSNLEDITPYIIQEMGSKCSNLHKIQFESILCPLYQKSMAAVLDIPLKGFFSSVGSNLLSIDLSNCEVPNISTVITWITDDCPNLEELYLVHVDTSSGLFPTNIVQKKCPKLKVLKLDGQINPSMERGEDGFPNLEVFAFEENFNKTMNNVILENILFRSSCLKRLDISFCDISPNTLYSLPANDLQILNMSWCTRSLFQYDSKFIKKWCHSLKTVDFSDTYSAKEVTNQAVSDLVSTPLTSPLEELYLANTGVKIDVVDEILKRCIKLRVLDLQTCEHLGHRMQKCFNGERELELLKDMVTSFRNIRN